MKIKTLGDFEKTRPRRATVSPLQARATLYGAMSDYMSAALDLVESGSKTSRERYENQAIYLVECLLFDARMRLSEEKYQYLLTHNIEDEGKYVSRTGDLMDSINHSWGSEDMFMFRLSGNLPGSYVKALTGLKGQLRHAGTTLPKVLATYT